MGVSESMRTKGQQTGCVGCMASARHWGARAPAWHGAAAKTARGVCGGWVHAHLRGAEELRHCARGAVR
eukprot:4701195-Prymnesium_polylepis.1